MQYAILLTPFHFFFNDTATTEIYTLSLHDALPIFEIKGGDVAMAVTPAGTAGAQPRLHLAVLHFLGNVRYALGNGSLDRKSTRLNSSHANISYAVFCLKKKKKKNLNTIHIINIHSG